MERVLIAGAGPVGLSAACALEAAGVAVTVLEAAPRLPQNLRASTFQPPTLDLLDRFGATRQLIEMGRIARKVQYRDRAGWVAELDFGVLADDTNHPYRVQCEQYKLNEVLAARLSDVRFNAEVVGAEQDADGVSAQLAGGAKVKGSYLIGADGGRSRVREAIGVRLEGFTWPERFLVASTPFPFEEVFPRLCDVSYFADPQEWFFLLRVRELWRVMFPTREEETDAQILSDDGIEQRLQRVHAKAGRYPIIHRTLYSVHQRVAEAYRKGRVFLAGDAAHLNNPLGGMGMNGGIHDAFNLAEKLVRGDLDAYERQRRPVALEYVNTITIANKRNLEMRDAQAQERWRAELARAMADRNAEREYMLKISMIASLRKHACA